MLRNLAGTIWMRSQYMHQYCDIIVSNTQAGAMINEQQ